MQTTKDLRWPQAGSLAPRGGWAPWSRQKLISGLARLTRKPAKARPTKDGLEALGMKYPVKVKPKA